MVFGAFSFKAAKLFRQKLQLLDNLDDLRKAGRELLSAISSKSMAASQCEIGKIILKKESVFLLVPLAVQSVFVSQRFLSALFTEGLCRPPA